MLKKFRERLSRMRYSASKLGKEYGLTGQEMNRVLVKHGMLKGCPSKYILSEEGEKYGIAKDHHRGNGGYPRYNAYWTTISYDEAIKDVLYVTPELKDEVRKEVEDHRIQTRQERESYSKTYYEIPSDEDNNDINLESTATYRKITETVIKTFFVIGGIFLIYNIIAPKIRNWWSKWKKRKTRE